MGRALLASGHGDQGLTLVAQALDAVQQTKSNNAQMARFKPP